MTPSDFYAAWTEHVTIVSRSFAPVVRRYGWEADDCVQTGLLRLWELAGNQKYWVFTDDELKPYLTVVIRREISKAARANKPMVSSTELSGIIDVAESRQHDALLTFCIDVIDEAPVDIGEYLRSRLFGYKPAAQFPKRLRTKSAQWLLAQLEGRVAK